MNTDKVSFWELLKETKIVIPIIQRDYAQGRLGKEYLRETFLHQLKSALNDGGEPIILDFVYGTKVSEIFNPLDGQQRLTTLWLLHWYIAYRLGKISIVADRMVNECRDNTIRGVLKKFSYETRISSREFCNSLCELSPIEGDSIVEHIKNQTWFYSTWKQDPTIESMLRMLGGTKIKNKKGIDIIDSIEELFEECTDGQLEGYWNKLTSDNCPIKFYRKIIDSEALPISDDLYIKMNARGKPLTDFENLKANIVDWMSCEDNLERDKFVEKNNDEVAYYQYISQQIDGDWTDVFWKNRAEKRCKETEKLLYLNIDEIFFAFINRYVLNSLIVKRESGMYNYSQDKIEKSDSFKYLYGNQSDDSRLSYTTFRHYEEVLSKSTIDSLNACLKNFKSAINNGLNITKVISEWNKSGRFSLIPEYIKNEKGEHIEIENTSGCKIKKISILTQSQRVLFYAICRYFEIGTFEDQSFREWMRIVCNLIENANINSITTMVAHIRLIDEIAHHSHKIYDYLADDSNTIKSDASKNQIEEERQKAKQILTKRLNDNAVGPNETEIIEVENYAFFTGAIRFLFLDGSGIINWDLFALKLSNAKVYFNDKGVNEDYLKDAKLLRRFISHFDKFELLWEIYFDNRDVSWRENLVNKKLLYPLQQLFCNNDVLGYDYSQYKSHNSNVTQKYVREYLINNTAISIMQQECRLRYRGDWIRGTYAIHQYNTKADWKIYFIHRRTELLFQDEISFSDYNLEKCRSSKLMFGKNVNFKYKEHCFQWYGTPNANDFDIYLMSENWAEYEQHPDLKNYCGFKIENVEDITPSEFNDKLDELLNSCNTMKRAD